MIHTKLLLCLLLLHACEYSFAKKCDSCISIHQCPEVLNLTSNMHPIINQKIQEAVCGTAEVDGKRHSMVCFSDLTDVSERHADTETNIESHENIALLPERCGNINSDRILNGLHVNLYEFPWLALVAHRNKRQNEFKCGGTIVSSRYVLTAAHCVVNKTVAGVRVGEYNMHTREDCQGEHPHYICEHHVQDLRVTKVIPHKDYETMPNVQNDIALLRLKKPIDFSFKNVAPVCLPIFNNLSNIRLDGKQATAAGWGITDFNAAYSVPRKVNIPIQSENECQEYYNRSIENKICTAGIGNDPCRSDPGGPLMLQEEYKGITRMIQFGVASYGPKQCDSSIPDVYTDVRKYAKWILDNIEP